MHHVLHPAHVAMWRTEQVGMDQLVCFVRIGQIVLASVFESDVYKRQVLERALKKSDNLCAESMFYHLAAKRSLHKRVTGEDLSLIHISSTKLAMP